MTHSSWIILFVVISLSYHGICISDATNKPLTHRKPFERFLATIRGGADTFEDRRRHRRAISSQQPRFKNHRQSPSNYYNNKYSNKNEDDLRSNEFQDQESSYHGDSLYVNEVVAAYTQSTAGKTLVAISAGNVYDH